MAVRDLKKSIRSNPNFPNASRRQFLKTTGFLAFGSTVAGPGLAAAIAARGRIELIADPADLVASAAPARWALGELKTALQRLRVGTRLLPRVADADPDAFCIIAGGMNSPAVRRVMGQLNLSAPAEAEALCLAQDRLDGRQVLVAAGTDDLGLVYALTELADRVVCSNTGRQVLEFPEPVIERPASRIRSVMQHFSSELEDKPWFYDRNYWGAFLDLLAFSRVNRLSFTMGMSYNSARGVSDGYFFFPYPFLVAVPGYSVRAKGLSDRERVRNLDMLRFIGQETARRGLHFQLGIWTLAYKWERSPNATYQIEGLTDDTHAAYCRDALALLLREVPAISGVTFRVHSESGIPKGQTRFWDSQFDAIARCDRCVQIDMHSKNIEPETLEAALATGQPVSISPKYCGEQLCLPYHPASIREKEMVSPDTLTDTGMGILKGNRGFTRYGYADYLAENRAWDVVFRTWPGAQRFLLNGDPATYAGYGRSASFCGAAGVEIFEPLGFKGRCGSGLPGGRCAYADKSLEPRYDFEKYRYTYRLWGRLGYSPQTDPDVWRRALRQEFGIAALAVENALAPASRVLPLFTLAHGAAVDCQVYWPEIYSNIPIAKTNVEHPAPEVPAPKVFGNVSPFDPQLFQSGFECGDTLVEGRATGKYSPIEVARWLEDIATASTTALDEARRQLGPNATKPAFRRLEEDVLIQCGLAFFFAGKLRSAVLWRIYDRTGHRPAAEKSIATLAAARDVWVAMAERAKAIYRPNITYGGQWTHGHWMDRIPLIDEDLADLRQRLQTARSRANETDVVAAERALKIAIGSPSRPVVNAGHTPASEFIPGRSLAIALSCGQPVLKRVTLQYRHVNQAMRWQSVELIRDGVGFQGEIPAGYPGRYPLQYYFELQTGPAEATLYPLLAADLSNTPYFVVRRANS